MALLGMHPPSEMESGDMSDDPVPQKMSHLDIAPEVVVRWRSVGISQGIHTDTDIACFLLHYFEENSAGRPAARQCSVCQTDLILSCPKCRTTQDDIHIQQQNSGSEVDSRQDDIHIQQQNPGSEVDSRQDDIHTQLQNPGSEVDSGIFKEEQEENLPADVSNQQREQTRSSQGQVKDEHLKGPRKQQSQYPELEEKSSDENSDDETDEYETENKERQADTSAEVQRHRRSVRRKSCDKVADSAAKCLECQMIFSSGRELEVHLMTHKSKAAFVCPDCGKTFKYRASFNTHRRQQGCKMPYRCSKCRRRFQNARTLKEHTVSQCGQQQKYKCGVCGSEFQERDLLNSHFTKCRRRSRSFACAECKESFRSQGDLEAHTQVDTPTQASANDMKQQHPKSHRYLNTEAPADLNSRGRESVPETRSAVQEPQNKPLFQRRCRGRPPKKGNQRVAGGTADYSRRGPDKETCNPVSCPQCGVRVSRARDLKIHMRVHTGEKPYTCEACKKPFRHRASYKLHIKQKCDGKPYVEKAGSRSKVQKRHQVRSTDSELVEEEQEEVCPKDKPGEGAEERQRADNQVVRTVCVGKNFDQNQVHLVELDAAQQQTLQQDLLGEDQGCSGGQDPYLAQQNLPKLSVQDHTLNQSPFLQQQTTHQEQPLQRWNPEQNIQDSGHQTSELTSEPEDISQDDDPNDPQQLFSHRPRGRRPIHPNKCVTCNICGVKISRRRDLKIHMRIHSGEKPYLCSECGEEFRQAAGLVAHNIRKHNGQRPYVCDKCGASFPLVGSLNQHMRIHNDVKRYTCDQCGKSFLRSSDLKGHIARHLGIKRFSCEDCKKTFSTSSELTKHKTLHTGEKPYVCPECRRAFRLQKSLKRHMRTHLKDKRTFHCVHCCKTFSNAEAYAEHCQMHPRENVNIYTCSDCSMGFFDANSLLKHQHDVHGWGTAISDS